MRCPFCDREFDAQAAAKACKLCAVFGGCQKVKCPHCGYESPKETHLVEVLRRWRRSKHD